MVAKNGGSRVQSILAVSFDAGILAQVPRYLVPDFRRHPPLRSRDRFGAWTDLVPGMCLAPIPCRRSDLTNRAIAELDCLTKREEMSWRKSRTEERLHIL